MKYVLSLSLSLLLALPVQASLKCMSTELNGVKVDIPVTVVDNKNQFTLFARYNNETVELKSPFLKESEYNTGVVQKEYYKNGAIKWMKHESIINGIELNTYLVKSQKLTMLAIGCK